MHIQYTSSYTRHGCNFQGNLALVEYFGEAQHGFCAAYKKGGAIDLMDQAKALIKETHPGATFLLAIPDVVARIP